MVQRDYGITTVRLKNRRKSENRKEKTQIPPTPEAEATCSRFYLKDTGLEGIIGFTTSTQCRQLPNKCQSDHQPVVRRPAGWPVDFIDCRLATQFNQY